MSWISSLFALVAKRASVVRGRRTGIVAGALEFAVRLVLPRVKSGSGVCKVVLRGRLVLRQVNGRPFAVASAGLPAISYTTELCRTLPPDLYTLSQVCCPNVVKKYENCFSSSCVQSEKHSQSA